MADGVRLNVGEDGVLMAADHIGSEHFARTKITIGADGVNDGDVSAANPLPVTGTVIVGSHEVTNAGVFAVQVSAALPAGDNNIGDVDVLTVPADPFGLNADAASVSGSISAKLRQIATTGIPVTGTVTVAAHAVTNAGTFAVQNTAAIPAGTNNIGDVDVLTVPADPFGLNADAASAVGSISAKLRFIASTGIPVTGTVTVGSHAVTNAGTFAVQVSSIAAGDNNIGNVDIASALPAGTNNIGDVDVLTVPADPFGVNADAASATGSISAKLRFIASTGIPVTGTVTVASHAVTNAGVFVVQVDGAALTALQLLDDVVFTDDAAFTTATSKVAAVGFLVDEVTTDSADEGDIAIARVTPDRKQIVNPQPHTTGGLQTHRSIDLDEGTLEIVKAAPGCVYGMWVTNRATTTRFIKFYDAVSGTAGTGTPKITIGIPGNTTDNVAALFSSQMGIQFDTGICVGAVTGVLDNSVGAPDANDVIVNIFYK